MEKAHETPGFSKSERGTLMPATVASMKRWSNASQALATHLFPGLSFAMKKLVPDSYFVWAPGYLRSDSTLNWFILALSLTPKTT